MEITNITFIPTKPTGSFIGFANLEFSNSLELNSIGVHAKETGISITFPAKKLKSGFLKFDFKFTDPDKVEWLRAAIENKLNEIGFLEKPTIIQRSQ